MAQRAIFAALILATTAACSQTSGPAPDPLAAYAGAEYWYSSGPGTRPGGGAGVSAQYTAVPVVSDLRIAAPQGSQTADLFRRICLANDGNFAAAVPAARATGAFAAPAVSRTDQGADRYSFVTPDDQIEAVIFANDPLGDSCGVGRLDLSETYIIGPGVRFVPK